MKASERLAMLIAPAAKERFRLDMAPVVHLELPPGLGLGVKFRVKLVDLDVGIIESAWPIGKLLKHVEDGGRIVFDHDGSRHRVRGLFPHEMQQRQ